MQSVSNDNFKEEVLQADRPVLVEFFSDGCVPCKRMSPILAELEEEYEGIKIVKLNISFSADTAGEYSVMSSPTFVFFKDGNEVKRVRGVVGRDELEDIIEEVLE